MPDMQHIKTAVRQDDLKPLTANRRKILDQAFKRYDLVFEHEFTSIQVIALANEKH
jgi:homoserine kinase